MHLFNKHLIYFYTVIIFLSPVLKLNSQELDPTVNINLDKVSSDARDRLSNFKQDLTDYLSKTKFTNEDIVNDVRGKPYKIKCTLDIFFTTSVGFDYYEAQMVVSAQRYIYKTSNFSPLIRIKDEMWQMNYIKGQGLVHDELRFNNLTSVLDYYAYMIIGWDDDSWESMLGTKRFQKALDVVNMASGNSVTTGWSDNTSTKAARITYPQDLLSSKYDNFRKGVWIYHFAGLDSIQFNKRQALERMIQGIELIAQLRKSEIRSFTIKVFFDTKYLEIAQSMVDYYDKTIFRRLDEIDPDHVSTYDEYSKK